jgi:uncharacterized protein YggE
MMKHAVAVSLCLGIILGSIARADNEEENLRTISVTGTVETKVAPDHIVWSINLRDADPDLKVAKEASDQKVKAIVGLRKKLGIEEGDMETGPVRIHREYNRDERGNRTDFKEFVVSRDITIRQRDLKRFDEYLDTLVASADMEVNFSYATSNLYEIRSQTRLDALRVAQEKATQMADVVGAKLGAAVKISEDNDRSGWLDFMSNAAVVRSEPSIDLATERFVPGAITVKVSVNATFELE